MNTAKSLAAMCVGLLACTQSQGTDWPQFLGPTRNGLYAGNDLAESWPQAGPPIVWQKPAGHGWSGPVVSEQKLIFCHRQGDTESVVCLDAKTGDQIWKFEYPTSYQDDFGFDDGPRATPTISAGRVYTFGPQGLLHCLEFGTGKKLWMVDGQQQFAAGKGFFGMACSPLVEGDAVLLNIGGAKGAGIVAFNKTNGKVLWKASADEASYSSPVAATIGGRRSVLFLTREGLVAVDPKGGDVQFQYSWHSRNRMSVNAATPLVIGDNVFLSASYGTGAVLLRPHEHQVEKLWSSDDLLSNHYATSIEFNGFLYGINGRTDPGFSPRPKLRCVDLKTQKLCWETESIGAATLLRAGNRLIILTDKGELVMAQASPERFQPKSRALVFSSEVRAFPALADGFLFARSKDQLVCIDLRGKAQP
jgi:outer membrane protein assembly factor BamB